MVDEILKEMSPQFAKLYSDDCPGAVVEVASVADFLFGASERMLIEQLQYNLLFRWLLNEEIAEELFQRVLERAKPYMSGEHFTVAGTLIGAWASQKSLWRKDGSGSPDRERNR